MFSIFIVGIVSLIIGFFIGFSKYIVENHYEGNTYPPYISEEMQKAGVKTFIEYQKTLIDNETERMFSAWKEQYDSGRSAENIVVVFNPYALNVMIPDGVAHYTAEEARNACLQKYVYLKEEYVKNR